MRCAAPPLTPDSSCPPPRLPPWQLVPKRGSGLLHYRLHAPSPPRGSSEHPAQPLDLGRISAGSWLPAATLQLLDLTLQLLDLPGEPCPLRNRLRRHGGARRLGVGQCETSSLGMH